MRTHKIIDMGSGYRTFMYKGYIFHIMRASDVAGWYCSFAYTEKGRHPVVTDFWTSGDTHYFTMSDVMKGLKKEIDEGKFIVETERSYRLPSETQK